MCSPSCLPFIPGQHLIVGRLLVFGAKSLISTLNVSGAPKVAAGARPSFLRVPFPLSPSLSLKNQTRIDNPPLSATDGGLSATVRPPHRSKVLLGHALMRGFRAPVNSRVGIIHSRGILECGFSYGVFA